MSLLKELREAARKDHRIEYRQEFRSLANRLDLAMEELRKDINADSLALVSGLWARASRALQSASEPEDPAPISGAATQTEYRMAA